MKELVKPSKKTEVFESLRVAAFYERDGIYSQVNEYWQGKGWDNYSRGGSMPSQEDILF